MEEVRYFVDELQNRGVQCILKRESNTNGMAAYLLKIEEIQIWVEEEDLERANRIYGELSGYDASEEAPI